jgi:2-succinyl-5-enolpyruvyl-6-hydroxy-3-cyclohexene-1-carboxylate synthase
MTRLEPFRQLARLCYQKGIKNIVICPGSRNAALTIAFTSEPGLQCYSISDERSAGYIALGMALQTGIPTVLICTSGTAALNFAPAVAEAFFQEVPLLILTADRPAEWIHQYDGQTIFQEEVYGKHVKSSYVWFPDQDEEAIKHAATVSLHAIDRCQNLPKGPVHINIPIREPFYPESIEKIKSEWNCDISGGKKPEIFENYFLNLLKGYKKRLLVIGQQHNEIVRKQAAEFASRFGFVLISDCISNVDEGIKNQDQFLKGLSSEEKANLLPDLLISTDMSLISKSLKLLLREGEIKEHWHIQDNPFWIDPFRSLTKKLEITPEEFFQTTLRLNSDSGDQNYQGRWNDLQNDSLQKSKQYFEKEEFTEFHFLKRVLDGLPTDTVLHIGNSMSIRYMNALQQYYPAGVQIFCNRGTSGIDGSLSTAVGQALNTEKPVFCILGDLSFQYDKNALWNRYLPDNLKIVVLNNAGGIIFNMIDGPKRQESFRDFFRTEQPHTAEWIAKEFRLNYFSVRNPDEIQNGLESFLASEEKSILELFTDYETNTRAYKAFLNA